MSSLSKLQTAGRLSDIQAEVLIPAARLYQSLQQVHRLCLEGRLDPETAPKGLRQLLARAGEMPDFERLEVHVRATLAGVKTLFDEIIL